MRLLIIENSNPRILIWSILPSQFEFLNRDLNAIKKYSVRFLTILALKEFLRKGSIVFMDVAGVNYVKEYFGLKLQSPVFLQIPVPDSNRNIYTEGKHSTSTFNITYIGRSEIWKYYPLLNILKDWEK